MRPQGSRDVTKLPQWVQHRLRALEENAEAADARALAASTPGASNTCIHDYTGRPDSLRGLPPFARVRFGNDDSWIEVRLCEPNGKNERKIVDQGEAVIEVYSGSGRLSVHPNVSNSVAIKVEPR